MGGRGDPVFSELCPLQYNDNETLSARYLENYLSYLKHGALIDVE